jgi:chemotaxis protein histidine kinase CheA
MKMDDLYEPLEEKKKKRKKRKGGKRDGKGSKSKGYTLRDWFKGGGWVQTGGKYDGKPCAKQPGQKTKPYCRDPDDRSRMSKKERDKRAKKKRKEDPNPDRRGKAKNVKQKKSKKKNEELYMDLEQIIQEELEAVLDEKRKKKKKKKKKKAKRDACYHKVKSRYKVWPSAYASGALVKCRKVGAKNWGNSKKESVQIMIEDEIAQILHEKEEKYKPHDMYDPKSGEKHDAKKEKDHLDMADKGFVHVDPKKIEQILRDEGGAAGMDPFLKEFGEEMKDEIVKALDNMLDNMKMVIIF